jgi:cell division protein FtsB
VIARQLIVPIEPQPRPRAGSRAGRTAVEGRREMRRRARYAFLVRTVTAVFAVTLVVVAYLGLMANVTRMNFELTKNALEQAKLSDETARLDDQIARLESRDRLAKLAAQLGMRDPQTFAAVALPPEVRPEKPAGVVFLSWLK